MENEDNELPILNFDAFLNGIIPGLTLSEINECMSITNITSSLQELDGTSNTLEECSITAMSPVSDEQLKLQKGTTSQE